jgi:methionyl-tRNA formyltransferase
MSSKEMDSQSGKAQTRIAVVTQDEPFYIPVFMRNFLDGLAPEKFIVTSIVVSRPFDEGTLSLALRTLRFYGFADFLRRAAAYACLRTLSAMGLAKYTVKAMARRHSISVRRVADINDPHFITDLRAAELDVILSVTAPQIFKEELLGVPKWGCINVHSAMLPKYRGMMPNFWAMYHGDSYAGITIHRMDAKVDEGKMILQSEIPIHPKESLNSLVRRSKQAGAELAIRALEQIRSGTAELRSYSGEASYFSFPGRKHVQALRARGHRLL